MPTAQLINIDALNADVISAAALACRGKVEDGRAILVSGLRRAVDVVDPTSPTEDETDLVTAYREAIARYNDRWVW